MIRAKITVNLVQSARDEKGTECPESGEQTWEEAKERNCISLLLVLLQITEFKTIKKGHIKVNVIDFHINNV